MIPDSVFDTLLRSLSLTAPNGASLFTSTELIPASFATDGTNKFSEPPIRLWYRTDCNPTFEHFTRRLEEELKHIRHIGTSTIARVLVTLYALRSDREERPTAVFNDLLSHIVDGRLSQFLVFSHPPSPGFQEFRIGEFSIGELRFRSLRNCCRDAGSDFFNRYKERLIGRFAIERDASSVRIVDWNGLRSGYGLGTATDRTRTIWNRGIEAYFGAIADVYFDGFWERLLETQNLLTASGAPFLDERQLRLSPFAQYISVFFEIDGSWGHVYPGSNSGFIVDLGSMDRRIPNAAKKLWDEFGVDVNADLAPPLKNYSLFIAKAIRYENDGAVNESLLHFVIALELLFGERQRTAESVSRRAATLVYRPLGVPLPEAESMMNKLYDARSRYVHAGQVVSAKLLYDAKKVCEEVLWALMRRLRIHPVEPGKADPWLRELDFIHSALIAGKSVGNDDLISCGILP